MGSAGYCALISQGPHLAARPRTPAGFRSRGKPSTANGVANNADLGIESSLRSYLFIQKRVISKRLLTTRKIRLAPTGAISFLYRYYWKTKTSRNWGGGGDTVTCALFKDLVLLSLCWSFCSFIDSCLSVQTYSCLFQQSSKQRRCYLISFHNFHMIHHLALPSPREPPAGARPCCTPQPHLWLLPRLGICTCSSPSPEASSVSLLTHCGVTETNPRAQSALGPDRTAGWPREFACSWWHRPSSTRAHCRLALGNLLRFLILYSPPLARVITGGGGRVHIFIFNTISPESVF